MRSNEYPGSLRRLAVFGIFVGANFQFHITSKKKNPMHRITSPRNGWTLKKKKRSDTAVHSSWPAEEDLL